MPGFYRFLCLIIALTLPVWIMSAPVRAQMPPAAPLAVQNITDPFTVEGVIADATAKSAVAAREKAFEQAQIDAFTLLAERLLPPSQFEQFTPPPAQTIGTMVNDFEVTDEKRSAVRYIGTYTFRFRENVVRRFLGASNIAYTASPSRPVLILPWYQSAPGRTALWEADNPWLAAWHSAQTMPSGGAAQLVPVSIPLGDLEDMRDLPGVEPLSYNPAQLSAMLARYHADRAVIAVAAPVSGAFGGEVSEINVTLYNAATPQPSLMTTITIGQNRARPNETLYQAAARIVRETLAGTWKEQNALHPAVASLDIEARVRFSAMQDWIGAQQNLRRIQGMRDISLISLRPGEALIKIAYGGSETQLSTALRQAGMALVAPDNMWDGKRGYYEILLHATAQSPVQPYAQPHAQPYDAYPAPQQDQNRPTNNWREELYGTPHGQYDPRGQQPYTHQAPVEIPRPRGFQYR